MTILVPNNSAFKKLEKQVIEEFIDDVEKADEVYFQFSGLWFDTDFCFQFVSRHILTEPICCEQISRNSGPFFNNNRKTSLSGQLISVDNNIVVATNM